MYMDYSNAFNTIDQDKLLQIPFDLNFPNVAIDAVKDLYTGAVVNRAVNRHQDSCRTYGVNCCAKRGLAGRPTCPCCSTASWLPLSDGYKPGAVAMTMAALKSPKPQPTPASNAGQHAQAMLTTTPSFATPSPICACKQRR